LIVTVFRTRLRDGVEEEYSVVAERMSALAQEMPGYISHKTFVAEDGERVTIVEFARMEDQLAWRKNAEHTEAMRLGLETFYREVKILVCEILRT